MKSQAVPFAVIFLAFGMIGCGAKPPEFSEQVKYTPKALAEELALRAKAADNAKSAKANTKSDNAQEGERGAPNMEALTKAAPNTNIEEIVKDILIKAGTVTATPFPETRDQIIQALEADAALSPSLKTDLSKRLKNAESPGSK